MKVREIGEIGDPDLGSEFHRQCVRVICADAKDDDRSDVAKDRLQDLGFDLGEVLLSQHQAQPVLTQFREHEDQALRSEIVELVEIEGEVASLIFLNIRAAQCRQIEAGNEQGTKKVGSIFSDTAFRE